MKAGDVCPKCNGGEIVVRWHEGRYATGKNHRCGWGDHCQPHGEHLHYRCDLCLYDWTGPVVVRRDRTAERGAR